MNYEERDTYGMYKHGINSGPGPDARHGPGPDLMGADTLVGNSVCGLKGDALGDIKEIMLDMRTGEVGYAVLAFGGFLGMGEKLFAVPWRALTLDTRNKRFMLNVARERLAEAPGFNKDKWPNLAAPYWTTEVNAFYGTLPGAASPVAQEHKSNTIYRQ